jgi:hypothetical protein
VTTHLLFLSTIALLLCVFNSAIFSLSLIIGLIINNITYHNTKKKVNGFGHVAGSSLAGHKDIKKVDFTGGTSTGRTIAKQIDGVKHYCAELGGNCPVVVFPDADILEVSFNRHRLCCVYVYACVFICRKRCFLY